MSFTIDSLHGYDAKKRYEKKLRFVRMFGNSRDRSIIMKDENGVELLWSTSDYTKTYQNFRIEGIYRFTVNYILKADRVNLPQIKINYLTLIK